MGYHIKRDGAFLCKEKIRTKGFFINKNNSISFSDAHKCVDLKYNCCGSCIKRYYEIVSKLKNPIIV
jgi:hypothetical protein